MNGKKKNKSKYIAAAAGTAATGGILYAGGKYLTKRQNAPIAYDLFSSPVIKVSNIIQGRSTSQKRKYELSLRNTVDRYSRKEPLIYDTIGNAEKLEKKFKGRPISPVSTAQPGRVGIMAGKRRITYDPTKDIKASKDVPKVKMSQAFYGNPYGNKSESVAKMRSISGKKEILKEAFRKLDISERDKMRKAYGGAWANNPKLVNEFNKNLKAAKTGVKEGIRGAATVMNSFFNVRKIQNRIAGAITSFGNLTKKSVLTSWIGKGIDYANKKIRQSTIASYRKQLAFFQQSKGDVAYAVKKRMNTGINGFLGQIQSGISNLGGRMQKTNVFGVKHVGRALSSIGAAWGASRTAFAKTLKEKTWEKVKIGLYNPFSQTNRVREAMGGKFLGIGTYGALALGTVAAGYGTYRIAKAIARRKDNSITDKSNQLKEAASIKPKMSKQQISQAISKGMERSALVKSRKKGIHRKNKK